MTEAGYLNFRVIIVDYCYNVPISFPSDYWPSDLTYKLGYPEETMTFSPDLLTSTTNAMSICLPIRHTIYALAPGGSDHRYHDHWAADGTFPFQYTYGT